MTRVRPVQPRHIPKVIKELLATHEILRRLGFRSEDIYCCYYSNQIAVVLKTQGMEFTITCGEPGMSGPKFAELWTRACALWNGTEPGMTGTSRAMIFHNSEMISMGVFPLVNALKSKGFTVPMFDDPNFPRDEWIQEAVLQHDSKRILVDANATPAAVIATINSKGGSA